MAPDEKDVPESADYKKSTQSSGVALPDLLTQKTGFLIGIGIMIVIAFVAYALTHLTALTSRKPVANALDSHPGFSALRTHVESLAEVDSLCAKEDHLTCLCELSDRIRDDHRAIETLIASDTDLKSFQIVVRKFGTPVTYDLAKLPQSPGEADCLNAVSAPTLIDEDGSDSTDESPAPSPTP